MKPYINHKRERGSILRIHRHVSLSWRWIVLICLTLLTISLSAQNNPPIFKNDTFTVYLNTWRYLDVQKNDSDPDGDNLITTSILVPPQHGISWLAFADSIVYWPNGGYLGLDTLGYRLCDDNVTPLCSDTAWVFINVVLPPAPPIALDDIVSLPEDDSVIVEVQANDTDPNGDSLGTTIYIGPSLGSAIVINKSIQYIPFLNNYGFDTIQYIVCDPILCDTASVYITIVGSNDPPFAAIDSVFMEEDSIATFNILLNDYDTDGVIVLSSVDTIGSLSNGSMVNNLDSTFTYTPNGNFFGLDSIRYQICDNDSTCDTGRIVITVNPVNDQPVAVDDGMVIMEDIKSMIDVQANDYDIEGGQLFTSILTMPNSGSAIVLNFDSIQYTPGAHFFGFDTMQYIICDIGGLCDTSTIMIVTTSVNDFPYAITDTVITDEDVGATINIVKNDYDVDGILIISSLALSVGPDHGSLIFNYDSTISYTPAPNYFGIDSFRYIICDDQGDCSSGLVLITVNDINDPPLAKVDTTIINMDLTTTLNVLLNDLDIDGYLDLTTVDTIFGTLNGTIFNNNDSTFTYSPNSEFNGIDSFTYIVCDNGFPILCDTAKVILIISTDLSDEVPFFIPEGFSPNGDGINEYFEIGDIENYPGSELIIFDRYQKVIYKNSSYTNNWRGTGLNGKDLPDGTYFYLLKMANGKRYMGYIALYR